MHQCQYIDSLQVGRSGDRILVGGREFPYPSRSSPGPTQPPVQWAPGLCPERKAVRTWRWPPTPSSADLYSPSGPLWSVLGWLLHFTFTECIDIQEEASSLTTNLLTYLFTYLLTYSMVQSPSWEANWFAASQEIPRISRNPKVHYRTHKRPPPVSILGQLNPVHIPTSHLLEIYPNIHPTTPRSPQWSLSLRFPQQDPI